MTYPTKQLHELATDPILDSANFLNEILLRFPDAISFAPGAPNEDFFSDINIERALNTYRSYLASDGLTQKQIDQHFYQYNSSKGQINRLIANMLCIDEEINIPPKAIAITVGCQEALLTTLRTLLRSKDDMLLVIEPCYTGLIAAAKFLNLETFFINEIKNTVDIEAINAACKHALKANKKIKALYVAPDYSNPTGTLLSQKIRRELIECSIKNDFFIIEDSTYRFTHAKQLPPTLKSLDATGRVVLIGSFSKILCPAVRIGYIVADLKIKSPQNKTSYLAEQIAAIKNSVSLNTSPICQAIVGGILLENNCSLKKIAAKKSNFYQKNIQTFYQSLSYFTQRNNFLRQSITWNTVDGGFFIILNTPHILDDAALLKSARDYGVLWTPLSYFYFDSRPSTAMRIAISYLPTNKIEEGVKRLTNFINDHATLYCSTEPIGNHSSDSLSRS